MSVTDIIALLQRRAAEAQQFVGPAYVSRIQGLGGASAASLQSPNMGFQTHHPSPVPQRGAPPAPTQSAGTTTQTSREQIDPKAAETVPTKKKQSAPALAGKDELIFDKDGHFILDNGVLDIEEQSIIKEEKDSKQHSAAAAAEAPPTKQSKEQSKEQSEVVPETEQSEGVTVESVLADIKDKGTAFKKTEPRTLYFIKDGVMTTFHSLSAFKEEYCRVDGAKLPTVGSQLKIKGGVLIAGKKIKA